MNFQYRNLLNQLDVMQGSGAYAARRSVLRQAETAIVALETERAALRQQVADLEQALRENLARAVELAQSWGRAVYNGTHVGNDIREQLQIEGPQ